MRRAIRSALRALRARANYKENTLCLDAVAVVVNPANKLEDISILQLFDIYTGAVKKFSEIDG